MQAPLPSTAQGSILVRPRINQLLATACSHSLAVVTAGTGYGKSLAVRSYLENTNADYLWLQLTALDNYTARFWDIYTHGIKSKSAELAAYMAKAGFPDTLEKTYQFLKELAKAIYPHQHCFLVLDDFHKIEDPAILNLIETIAYTNLENFTIVLISRYPLAIDYSGLFNNRLLYRVSVADLRFTSAETAEYFEGIGLHFTPQVLENIQRSTEGWPLALYLIGLHRQNDGRLFDDPISCTIPLLYSLIEIEIFSGYSEPVKRGLIKLSLLDSVTPELVKRISGPLFPDLEQALQQNHFVYYNPQAGQYHLHRLFRRFLQSKKAILTRREQNDLYFTAGEWCAAEGKHIEAITYFKNCKHYPGIWNIIRSYGQIGYTQDMAKLCLDMCEAFPPEFHEQQPLLAPFRAYLLMQVGEFDRAYQSYRELLLEYESLPLTEARRPILGEIHLGLAHMCIIRADYTYAHHYRKAAEYLTEGGQIITSTHEYIGNHYALYMFEAAPGAVQRILDISFEIHPLVTRALNGCGYGVEYLAAAEADYFRVRLGTATEYTYQALYRAREKQQHDIVCSCHLMLMSIHFASGDYHKTVQQLNTLQQYYASYNSNYHQGLNSIGESWFYIQMGMLEKVPPWLLAADLNPKTQAMVSIGREKTLCALYFIRKQDYFLALQLLDNTIPFYTTSNAYFSHLQACLLKAICHMRLNDSAFALDAFSTAYDLAYHNKLHMFFIELGQDMIDLIEYVRGMAAFDEELLANIVARAAAYQKKAAFISEQYSRAHEAASPFTTLTAREKDVLALLCRGATREEIASQYGVSVSTVKTNLKSIFVKLGALNRADAVRIAIDSGLISKG